MTDPIRILRSARTILLVDWPSPSVPRALVEAKFIVVGFCPPRYSRIEVVAKSPDEVEACSIVPPQDDGPSVCLAFRPMEVEPRDVDVVCAYRPAEEIPGIVARFVIPLGAKALWLQPPITS